MVVKRKLVKIEEKERRVSPRISEKLKAEKHKEEKTRLVLSRVKLLDDDENGTSMHVKDETVQEKQISKPAVSPGRRCSPRVKADCVKVMKKSPKKLNYVDEEKKNECGVLANRGMRRMYGYAAKSEEKSAHVKVKETLRLFNKHYLHFVQVEEKRCGKSKIDEEAEGTKSNGKAGKTKGKGTKVKANGKKNGVKGSSSKKVAASDDGAKKARRPDLKAVTEMKNANDILYSQKQIGNLPGIDVGHQFYSRAEMCVLGFHGHWLNGIDYMGNAYCKGEYSSYTFPLAVSIVISGMYEDDLDNADEVVYTGQGGHNLNGNKRQIRDQVLERGNLALKNCVDHSVPVRVIRGHESASSYTGKVYTYDGLYKVVQYWVEKGISGFTVYKYRLKRLDGQPNLTTNQVNFVHGGVPKSISEIQGLVCQDITGGQEDVPIPATNRVDDPPVSLTGFTYRKSLKVGPEIKIPRNASGCKCKGSCVDSKICACARLNGSDFPYVHRDGGRLIEPRDVVFECGPNCGCGPGCVNRTSQRGLRYRFEVFRTPKKGWAVRSWDFIPSGAPVCEYIGVLRRTEDVDNASDNDYIFDIDCLQTMQGLGGRERRLRDVSVPTMNNSDGSEESKADNSAPMFCIDAGSTGNIARFINHSCEPNLFVQCVMSSHNDLRLARVVLFAADNIPPLQELTYDYGYALDSVHGPDGRVKQLMCFCGAAACRKRLY